MNCMCIIGNLTKDPELRSTQTGVSVCSFTVAVNRRKKGKNGEDLPAMFYRVTTWRQYAESCGKYLKKGSKVYVDGDLSVNTYKGNDGETRFSLEIEAGHVEFLSIGNEVNSQDREQVPVNNPPSKPDHQIGFTEVQDVDDLPF